MSKLSVTRPSHIFAVRTSGSYTRTKADEILSQSTGNRARARTVVIRDLLAIPIVSLDFSSLSWKPPGRAGVVSDLILSLEQTATSRIEWTSSTRPKQEQPVGDK